MYEAKQQETRRKSSPIFRKGAITTMRRFTVDAQIQGVCVECPVDRFGRSRRVRVCGWHQVCGCVVVTTCSQSVGGRGRGPLFSSTYHHETITSSRRPAPGCVSGVCSYVRFTIFVYPSAFLGNVHTCTRQSSTARNETKINAQVLNSRDREQSMVRSAVDALLQGTCARCVVDRFGEFRLIVYVLVDGRRLARDVCAC